MTKYSYEREFDCTPLPTPDCRYPPRCVARARKERSGPWSFYICDWAPYGGEGYVTLDSFLGHVRERHPEAEAEIRAFAEKDPRNPLPTPENY